jgi:hypothetical protein
MPMNVSQGGVMCVVRGKFRESGDADGEHSRESSAADSRASTQE